MFATYDTRVDCVSRHSMCRFESLDLPYAETGTNIAHFSVRTDHCFDDDEVLTISYLFLDWV